MVPLFEVVTVTLNPAIDQTLTVDSFTLQGTHRIDHKQTDPGGKGINVSRALAQLGIPSMAMGFIGEDNEALFTSRMEQQGIATDWIRCPGETRQNIKVWDPSANAITELNDAGFTVPPSALRSLWKKLQNLPSQVQWVALSGSIPPGVQETIYRDMIHLLKKQGKQVLLDTSGRALMEGITACPFLIKPNEEEMQQLNPGNETLSEQIEALHQKGISHIFLSLGAKGAIGSSPQEHWMATPPPIASKSTVGAGDAMVAAILQSLIKGRPLPKTLSWGVASGTAAASQSGTDFGTLEEIRTLEKQVQLEAL